MKIKLEATLNDFHANLTKIASDLNAGMMAVTTADDTIEFRKVNLWQQFLKLIGWKGYKESEVQKVMGTYLHLNRNFIEHETFMSGSVLRQRTIKIIPEHQYVQVLMINAQRLTLEAENHRAKIAEEVSELRKKEVALRSQISRLETQRNELQQTPQPQPTVMLQLASLSDIDRTHMDQMRKLRGNSEKADIFLKSGDGKTHAAHSLLLEHLPYFSVARHFSELSEKEVEFDFEEFSSEVIDCFLDRQYGIPTKELTFEQMIEMYWLAHYVGAEQVENEAKEALLSSINETNKDVRLPDLFPLIFSIQVDLRFNYALSIFFDLLDTASESVRLNWDEFLANQEKEGHLKDVDYLRQYRDTNRIENAFDLELDYNKTNKFKNKLTAIKHLKKEAYQGNIRAQKELADLYIYAKTTQSAIARFTCLQKKAQSGSALDQLFLGDAYEYGIGTAKDEEFGFYWYGLAASYENAIAECRIAARYMSRHQLKLATQFYVRAAQHGSAAAQYYLAELYAGEENAVLKSLRDDPTAMALLQDGGRNDRQALELYRKAEKTGYWSAATAKARAEALEKKLNLS